MRQVVVLLEEDSARIVVEALAVKLGIDDARLVAIPHQGLADLKKSIRNKLSNWRSHSLPRFVILRDNDQAACKVSKGEILDLIPPHTVDRAKVRVVMQELEAWYFGDLQAIEAAGLIKNGAQYARKAKFRNPDAIQNPKKELRKLIVPYPGQTDMARRFVKHMDVGRNSSTSFRHFCAALQWAAAP